MTCASMVRISPTLQEVVAEHMHIAILVADHSHTQDSGVLFYAESAGKRDRPPSLKDALCICLFTWKAVP